MGAVLIVRRARQGLAGALLVAALAMGTLPAACGRSRPSDLGITGSGGQTGNADGGSGPSADGSQTSDGASMSDAQAAARTSCLDQPPTELPRPPAGQLPCDLIPPGLTL